MKFIQIVRDLEPIDLVDIADAREEDGHLVIAQEDEVERYNKLFNEISELSEKFKDMEYIQYIRKHAVGSLETLNYGDPIFWCDFASSEEPILAPDIETAREYYLRILSKEVFEKSSIQMMAPALTALELVNLFNLVKDKNWKTAILKSWLKLPDTKALLKRHQVNFINLQAATEVKNLTNKPIIKQLMKEQLATSTSSSGIS